MTQPPGRGSAVEIRDTRAGNWWWANNVILDLYVAEQIITPGEALVYFALCRLSRDGRCEKGVPEIARLAGAKDRFTRSAIAKLDDIGLIHVERRSDERGNLPNSYAIRTPPALRTGGFARDDQSPLSSEQDPPASGASHVKKHVKDVPQENGSEDDEVNPELREIIQIGNRLRLGLDVSNEDLTRLRGHPIGRTIVRELERKRAS